MLSSCYSLQGGSSQSGFGVSQAHALSPGVSAVHAFVCWLALLTYFLAGTASLQLLYQRLLTMYSATLFRLKASAEEVATTQLRLVLTLHTLPLLSPTSQIWLPANHACGFV